MNDRQQLLREGDVIVLTEAHLRVARLLPRAQPGRYVVYKTALAGGGTGHGPHDVYPDGHRVSCERLDGPQEQRVCFYQTGCFTNMLPDIKPVGRAVRRWIEVG